MGCSPVAVVQYTFTGKQNTERHKTNNAQNNIIDTPTIHRTTQFTSQEEFGPCRVFARHTLAFVLQLRKKHGKTSVRIAEECQLAR
jgi:hypothetical protein